MASFLSAEWLEEYNGYRVAHWHQNNSKLRLDKWRTRSRQRFLIVTYLINVALMLAVAIAQLFTFKVLWLWIVGTVIGSVAWTILRITINSKDSAPQDVLDEYEIEILDHYRRLAHRGMVWALTLLGAAITLTGTWFLTDHFALFGISPGHWLYTAGLLIATVGLVFSTLPAIGFALVLGPSQPTSPNSIEEF